MGTHVCSFGSPVPPRASSHRGPAAAPAPSGAVELSAGTEVPAPAPHTPGAASHPTSEPRPATKQPGRCCAWVYGKRKLGSVHFPSWPNVMHKGRSVPAAADAPSPPEPPAHDQPYSEAGIFHSIPRHSDMLQCPGTLAAVPVSAADTQQQRCVARSARSHRANLIETNSSGKSRPEKAASGAKGVPAPLWGPAAGVTTLQRDRKAPNQGGDAGPGGGFLITTVPQYRKPKGAWQ